MPQGKGETAPVIGARVADFAWRCIHAIAVDADPGTGVAHGHGRRPVNREVST